MRAVADDDGPGANRPALDEAAADVGIAFHKLLDNRSAVSLEDEKSAVDGVGQRAAEDQFAAIIGLASQTKMVFAVGGALFEVADGEFVVEESKVGHDGPPISKKISPQRSQSSQRRKIISQGGGEARDYLAGIRPGRLRSCLPGTGRQAPAAPMNCHQESGA